jgi:2-C-methyl-D-erythritol 2,4-cyclodiphosphate synthase
MVLGGISFESDVYCAGHSDGDTICHALTDAILGAAGLGDIGQMFPDTDDANKNRNSVEMLRAAVQRVRAAGYRLGNADVTVIAERVKIAPHRDAMRAALAAAVGADPSMVFVKGKTNEGMDATGRGEGLSVIAVALLIGAKA